MTGVGYMTVVKKIGIRFRRHLTDVIARDGFDLQFVVLGGPDYMRRYSTPPWKAWDCEEIITSDAGRSGLHHPAAGLATAYGV
jgi:hypothetical protein